MFTAVLDRPSPTADPALRAQDRLTDASSTKAHPPGLPGPTPPRLVGGAPDAGLDSASAHRLSAAGLAAIVARVAADPSQWEPHVRQGAGECTAARLEVPEGIDIWVVAWRTFEVVRLRANVDATTAFATVRGGLTELRPDNRGRLLPRKFWPGLVHLIHPGEVHDLRHEQATGAVTIHAHDRRLTKVDYFRRVGGRVVPDRSAEIGPLGAHAW